MRRLISLLLLLLMMVGGTPTFAFDWKASDLELLNQAKDGAKITATLKDQQNREFKVIYQDESVMKDLLPQILKFNNEFYNWRKIQFKELSFIIFDRFLEVVIIPHEIIHEKKNLATVIPAGITMTLDPEQAVMRYDFRIIKNNQFIRITGDYIDETELRTTLGFAYDYPTVYQQKADSFNQSISGIDEKTRQALIYLNNEDWNGNLKAIPAETIKKVVDIKKSNPDLTKKEILKILKVEKIPLTKRELELILIIYFNEFE